MYWACLGAEDPESKLIQVIDDGGLHLIQLGRNARNCMA